MKLFLVLSVIFVAVNGLNINWDEISERQGRIASGQPMPKGRFLSFCSLTITFFQKQKTCGCVVLTPNYVATTARCVMDCSEGKATNVTVTVAGKPYQYESITVPPTEAYDPSADTLTNIVTNNAALIKLTVPLKVDDKTISAVLTNIPPFASLAELIANTDIESPYVKFYACGVGVTNNQRTPTKGPMCTEVKVLPPDACLNLITGAAYDPPPAEDHYCVQWPNRDNNICSGDYGGPIYISFLPPPGVKEPPRDYALGLAVGSPDIRPNAPCQDGHTVFAQFPSQAILDFANSIINPGAGRKLTVEEWKEQIDKLLNAQNPLV